MHRIRNRVALATLAGLCALGSAAIAAPVAFTVTPSAFTPDVGYGTGAGKLDVGFAATGSQQAFTLGHAGDSSTFQFGTITLLETGLITQAQTNDLGVSATFTFVDPLAGLETVTATGVATPGPLADVQVDFSINWDPITVAFGDTGSFRLSMNTVNFRRSGQSLEQDATIVLLSPPGTGTVPEPASLALVGAALLGAAAARRPRPQRQS